MFSDLPGYDEAMRLGYSVTAYSSDRKSADYVCFNGNKPFVLAVAINDQGNLVASLWALVRVVQITIPSLSFPHPKFVMFEDYMTESVLAVKKALGVVDE